MIHFQDNLYFTSSRILVVFGGLVIDLTNFSISIQCRVFVKMFHWIFLLFILFNVELLLSCYSILECYNMFSGVKLSASSLCFISPSLQIYFWNFCQSWFLAYIFHVWLGPCCFWNSIKKLLFLRRLITEPNIAPIVRSLLEVNRKLFWYKYKWVLMRY